MLQSKKTLVLGATPKPERYAYIATQMLTDYGHEVVPFGVKKGMIGDLTILNEWPEEKGIDTVTLYINPRIQKDFYDKIIATAPIRIIFNPGTENPEFEKQAEENGIISQRACTLVLLRTNQY